jgi:hypothetical protein
VIRAASLGSPQGTSAAVLEDINFLLKVVTGSIQILSLPQDENQVEGAKI